MLGVEEIRAKVCIAKLEVSRYDVICNNTLIKELQSLAKASKDDDIITECFEQLAMLYMYRGQIKNISRQIEASLQKSLQGQAMLNHLDDRMPP